MGWLFSDDNSAADRHKRDRDAYAERAIKNKNKGGSNRNTGSFLSWGGSGRAETKPGLFGLGSRVVSDIEEENAKKGRYGLFGGKAVATRASRADKSGKSRSTHRSGWFSS